jgi:uncharacterized protein (DUF1015 family)
VALIRPFAGIHYSKKNGRDVSKLIAPPYDVLDEAGRDALKARDPHNIVNIDLPHIPPKTAGPDAVYEQANATMKAWLKDGILEKDVRRALYPYAQTYDHGGKTFHRRGFIALVKLSPFGEGQVVPHEKTYKGPIEDRMKLMRATGAQLSPIFGLFSDPKNEINNALYHHAGKPELTGTLDGVRSDMWSVTDAEVENVVIDLMKHRPVYIADGHHRYTTALQYQAEATVRNGGPLPPAHPANYCMFVLVGMQDDGLLILPTHRLIGGLTGFSVEAFSKKLGANAEVREMAAPPERMTEVVESLSHDPPNMFALYDGKSKRIYHVRIKNSDVLKDLEPGQSDAWRRLDVAILQRYLLDEVLQPAFAGGKELTKGYTADASTIVKQVDGTNYQVALLLRPTPLHALEELGKVNEVMPQKSTYFFPKLATGMVMNPLE